MHKKIAQIATNYTIFKSPLPSEFKCAKTFAKFSKNFKFKKTENVQITFIGVCEKIGAKFLSKDCAIWLLLL